MSHIRVEDIAYVRFRAPDLARMAGFLRDFGLQPWLAEDGRLYARAAGGAPFVHVTELGEPGFAALGLRAACVEDLHRLARANAVAVADLAAPGGGQVVRLTSPDGHAVEIVAGQSAVPPSEITGDFAHNTAQARARLRQPIRLSAGPASVLRIGHAVLEVADFAESEAWFKAQFGFLTSDEIALAPGMALGAFLRCDRGATPTDHHTLFLLQSPRAPAFNHAAFEVAHLDDLMRGHDHLRARGHAAAWGVGRHILGSQIFDYWKDPWGHELEHWTDGDLFIAEDPPGQAGLDALLGTQWGPRHPMSAGD